VTAEVLVIGAGPAGLSAAAAALRAGARVVLLDAADDLGGQYWRHLPPERPDAREHRLHHGWRRFTALRAALTADPRCEVVTRAQVWLIERREAAPPAVHVLVGPADGNGRTPRVITPAALVLATGAYERTLPFPGWELPGVFTAGAAQALAKGERVAPSCCRWPPPCCVPDAASPASWRRAAGPGCAPAGPPAPGSCSGPRKRPASWPGTPATWPGTGSRTGPARRWSRRTATSGSRP
jgi:NADPH-dependent 2,4-dienoyl-CoA reductase/sulfur reductase-like enzyme